MKTSRILWLLPLICLTTAQRSSKPSKPTRQVSSQAYGHQANNNYDDDDDGSYPSQQPTHNQYAQPRQYQAQAHKSYAPVNLDKPVHAQILQDNRQLNHDGTINFNYATDNGLQQGETVDADGTRRGFYSYPGADGKQITVKYTAGKNGFQAEGDHLPRQPQVPPHSDNDEQIFASHKPAQQPQQQAYRPKPQQHYAAQPAPAYPRHQAPAHVYPSQNSNSGHYKPQPHKSNAVQYTAGPSQSSGGNGFVGYQDFGPVNYGAPSHNRPAPSYQAAAPQQQQYTSHVPSYSPKQSSGSRGQMFTADNPYQQAGPAGPYNAGFDLGNGGQFTIDFSPGQSQAVNPGGDYSGGPSQQRY